MSANVVIYIDPVNGVDGNDGLGPASPVKTLVGAEEVLLSLAISAGFNINQFSFAAPTQLDDPGYNHRLTTINLRFMGGVSVSHTAFKGSRVAGGVQYTWSSQIVIRLWGASGAVLLFAPHLTDAYFLLDGGVGNICATVQNLIITPAGSPPTTLYRPDGSVGAGPANIGISFTNCVIRNVPIVCNPSAYSIGEFYNCTATDLLAEDPNTATILTRCAEGSDASNLGLYSMVATPAKQLQGDGAFLPQPSAIGGEPDYAYDPAVAALAPFNGWVNDATYPGGTANVTDTSVSIATGMSARVRSRVYHYPSGIAFSSTRLLTITDEGAPVGSKLVIDIDKTAPREIEVVAKTSPFNQTDEVTGWVSIPAGGSHERITGNYIQFRITLRADGE